MVMIAAAALLALGATGAIVWAEVVVDQDTIGSPTPSGSDRHLPSDASAPGRPTPPGSAKAVSCARKLAAADPVIAAARTGIGHWAEHIQARTNLLSGAQSKAVTAATWKRTRLAGPTDLVRYSEALAEYHQLTADCAAVRSEPCRQRYQAMVRALSAANAGMADWRSHLEAMAAHKAGAIDAAHAQHLWVAAWAAAPRNLNAWRGAEAVLMHTPDCPE